jgi:hypothetical protein
MGKFDDKTPVNPHFFVSLLFFAFFACICSQGFIQRGDGGFIPLCLVEEAGLCQCWTVVDGPVHHSVKSIDFDHEIMEND